jgi:hypothetical protein
VDPGSVILNYGSGSVRNIQILANFSRIKNK